MLAYRQQVGYKVPYDESIEHPRRTQKEEQEKIDNAQPLTEQELGKITNMTPKIVANLAPFCGQI